MPSLLRELNHLVFDRWTITRSDSFDCPRVKGRFMQVVPDLLMQCFVRIGEKTIQLSLLNVVCRERERNRTLVWRLRLKNAPVYCASIQTRRSPCLQTAYRKPKAP